MGEKTPLEDYLEAAIPIGVNAQIYHISTRPERVSAIFAAAPGDSEEKTFCEHHFLVLSSPKEATRPEIFIFAIEVLIFTTETLTTVFVSKADSSGFSSRINSPRSSPSIVAIVTATFLDFLLKPRLSHSRVILSLFARSQKQYIFPGSVENLTKHILDDRRLIKWWCRILDTVSGSYRHDNTSNPQSNSNSAYLVVPGCDSGETKAFFPLTDQTSQVRSTSWSNAYPADQLVPKNSLPLRCLIPRLPDDPKARFSEDLDSELIDGQGDWRSVKSLDQFWEMMSYRQECSAGRLVGFAWLVFSQSQSPRKLQDGPSMPLSTLPLQEPEGRPGRRILEQEKPSESGLQESAARSGYPPDKNTPSHMSSKAANPATLNRRNLSDETLPEKPPDIENVRSTEENLFYDEAQQIVVQWPESTRGQVVLSMGDFQLLMDQMLQGDFAGEKLAVQSSQEWIQKVAKLSNCNHIGSEVVGKNESLPNKVISANSPKAVNILTSVRKKRKAENGTQADVTTDAIEPPQEPTSLSANLIRKKPKAL